jgi:hypothetical protein
MSSRRFFSAAAIMFTLLALGACSRRSDGPGPSGNRDGSIAVPDWGVTLADAGRDFGAVNECNPSCGPVELCGEMNDGNGLDDNCDGRVDEGCQCPADGITRPCFAGPPDRRNVGACADGIQTCSEFGWGGCFGGVSPSDELCDGLDNDCNGQSDDVAGCTSAIQCPGNDASRPLSNYTLDGDRVFAGNASNWSWSVDCPASVGTCPAPENPNSKDTQIYFAQSGAYRVRVELTPEGESQPVSCVWTVYVAGDGLRVEMDWETMRTAGVDIDLHLHRWTQNGTDTDYFTGDDCYFGNCTPGDEISWSGHPDTDLSNCENAPSGGGAAWRSEGACRNPRLDVDTNGLAGRCSASQTDPNANNYCSPENINVDNPILGQPYRIMAHYFAGSGGFGAAPLTYTNINIYCGGALRATLGNDPAVGINLNETWIVADVVFSRGVCGQDCQIYPLGAVRPASGSGLLGGYDETFGPEWSCNYDAANNTCTPR